MVEPAASLLFYDLETSGLNRCFDQVLQFAAIRTDLQLVEQERYEIWVRPNPDLIPSPAAILVHKISLARLLEQGEREYSAIAAIHRLLNTPGTISIGYNSLGFDDEFLRFSFYRNLLDPYSHQYANFCKRMDLYPMAIIYYLFSPDGLKWPEVDGIISFKLEYLAAHNQLLAEEGEAHDAMVDVQATLALARRFRQKPAIWDYLTGYFDKHEDAARLDKLPLIDQQRSGLLISSSLGRRQIYQSSVIYLGMHHHYRNQSLWLPLDLGDFATIPVEQLVEAVQVQRKRLGEPPVILPMVERFAHHLTPERRQLAVRNRRWLQEHPELLAEIALYHQEYKYPEVPNLDADADLYQLGFLNQTERNCCGSFHRANGEQKLKLAQQINSSRLRQQIIRVLGRNYPEILTQDPQLATEFRNYLEQLRAGKSGVNYRQEPRLTPAAALTEIDQLRQGNTLTPVQRQLLEEITNYIQSW